MKDSLQNIVDILAEPSAAFARLKSEPKWLLGNGHLLSVFCWNCVGYTSFYSNRLWTKQLMEDRSAPSEAN